MARFRRLTIAAKTVAGLSVIGGSFAVVILVDGLREIRQRSLRLARPH